MTSLRLPKGRTDSRSPIKLPTGLGRALVPIGREAARIHESSEFSAQAQFEQAKIWRTLNYWLGVPAAATAALAGSAILGGRGDWTFYGVPGFVLGGVLALASAALSATLTTINAARRMNQAQSSGNAYLQLQTEARQLITIDLRNALHEDARQALQAITNSRNELNKTAEVPGRLAYRRARKNLYVNGGQDYSVDEED